MARGPRWRVWLSWLFVLIFCLAAPLALLAGWARLVVSDPEAYARTVRSVADDPRVQTGLAGAVAQHAEGLLAGDNPTATEAVQSRVMAQALSDAVAKVIDSDEFLNVWEAANREAHAFLFSELSAGWGEPVTLDLSPLADNLQLEVERIDLELPVELRVEPEDLQIAVLDAAYADQIRRATEQLNRVFWVSLAVMVASFVLAITLAPDRLAMLGRTAFGVTVTMVALIALLLVAQGMARSAAGAGGGGAALGAITDAISQGLRVSAVGLALGGLLLAGIFSGLGALRRTTVRRAALG